MAKAMDVADDIITVAKQWGKPVSNLVLQKAMYFLNAAYLVDNNKRLIDDKCFEKWDYGPVIPSVYTEYSNNGANPILATVQHKLVIFDNDVPQVRKCPLFNKANFDKNNVSESKHIAKYLGKLLSKDPWDLVNWSHKEPQWLDKSNPFYSDEETYNFYKVKKNRIW